MDKHKPKVKYSKINNHIYIGTNACCQTHFSLKLLRKGIRADISLEKERLDNPLGVEVFLWLPTVDMTAPSQRQLKIGVSTIDSLINSKTKIYIHCKNGHGRAPTLTAAYFISKGMEVKEAISLIKKKRPEIHLNKKQISALNKFKNNMSLING